MSTPFQPEGDEAHWRTLYSYTREMDIGDTITYSEMTELLQTSKRSAVSAAHRAMRELEEVDMRTLVNVRNVGYRIAEAREHEGLAVKHQRKSRRQIIKSKRKIASADRSKLTNTERQRLDTMEVSMSRLLEMHKRLTGRVTANEKALQDARRKQSEDAAELSEQVSQLREALERAGIETPTS